jgi:CRP-like cAMP-binding protein
MAELLERILLLKKSDIFREVNTEDLRVVAYALEEEAYFNGDRLFDINDYGDQMYIITSGKVAISIEADPTLRHFVAELGTGECVGEMAILDNLPRSATAHVIEDATFLVLDKARLKALILRYPELALGMMRGLSARLRSANQRS